MHTVTSATAPCGIQHTFLRKCNLCWAEVGCVAHVERQRGELGRDNRDKRRAGEDCEIAQHGCGCGGEIRIIREIGLVLEWLTRAEKASRAGDTLLKDE